MHINETLKQYLTETIIPKYQILDLAHQSNHVYNVINYSLEIAKNFDVNYNMVYTIASFHDIGLIVEREKHHLIGANMLEKDKFINSFFSKEEIQTMKEAVEDHRGSNELPPRSIYGMIVAEADRSNSMDEIIERSFQYSFTKNGYKSFNESFKHVYNHIQEKYGDNGYLKVWINTKRVKIMLSDIRTLLKDKDQFEKHSKSIYDNLLTNDSKISK